MTATAPEITKLSDCIAPSFTDLHKQLKEEEVTEVWERGGRGSTKSSFTSVEVILGIMKNPEANGACFRRFENEIRDSVFSQLEWATSKLGVHHLFTFRTSPFKIIYDATGQVILFKGADNPKKVKSAKLATGYIKYIWFEEVDQFGGMDDLRNIEQSFLRGTTEKQIAFYTYNPPKSARSWANAESKAPKAGRVVHYSDYRDVPEDWLGPKFLANALHLKETNEDAYKHEYLGEETGTGLEVFNNVKLRKITPKEISYFDSRNQGLDFGYTVDPTCFLEGHYVANVKTLYLFFEISGVGLKHPQLAHRMSEDQRHEVTMCDQDQRAIDDLRQDHKVNVVGAEKPPGSVDHGIKYLQDLDQIIIDPSRCPLAATEFINYALKTDRNGETISKYPDKDNHAIDATRYMMNLHIMDARKAKRKKFKTLRLPVASRW